MLLNFVVSDNVDSIKEIYYHFFINILVYSNNLCGHLKKSIECGCHE